MALAIVAAVVLVLLSLRSRQKKRRRPATGADLVDAAVVAGTHPHYVVLPVGVDPVDGYRDVGF